MTVLYITEPADDGMVSIITDTPCPGEGCGWGETVVHLWPDGTAERGCPNCETTSTVEGTIS